MKRIIGLFSFVLVVFGNLSAYDYQTVYSHRTALFASSYGQVKTMKIDSVKFNGDSILYPLKNIQELDYSCYTPYGASWLGYKIIIKPGWNYFFNQNNDTIRIKTDAKLNERWTVYSNTNISVFATVQKIETVNFLGITDIVKTIAFDFVIATSGMPEKVKSFISGDFDGKTIQISKNYGLIKTFNFLIFPYPSENSTYYYDNWNQYILSGLTNPKLGVQNLTWFDVFDFQVGDELHILYTNTPPMGSPPPGGYIYKTEEIAKYLSKETYSDSIVYNVEIREQTYSSNGTNFRIFSKRDVIQQNNQFNSLPDVPLINENYANYFTMNINSTNVSKSNPSIWNEIIKRGDCWNLIIADGCFRTNSYIKALGGPYYSCAGLMMESEERSLVYYKKGNVIWGAPFINLSVNNLSQLPDINISPNPATDKITVQSLPDNENYAFELLDLKGSIILKTTVNASQNTVNLSQYDKGMYLYRISDKEGLLKAGKIVKN